MSLNLVIGKSNSGKSEYIMNKMMACDNKQAILFVPASMRVIAEQEYLKYTNKKGIVDVSIISIDRFVDKNVNKSELYKSKEYLSELAKKLLVRKVILENQHFFEIFAKVKNNTNFLDRLCSYIDSAKNQSLSSEDILSKYTDEDFLGKKLKEFGKIYSKVEETLNERFVSSIDAVKYYTNEISGSNNFKDYDFFFDGYNNFSKVEYEYIKALLLSGANITITLEIDLEKHLVGATEIFTTTYDTLEYLKNMALEIGVKCEEVNLTMTKKNRPEDLEFLATNIFDLSKNTYNKEVQNVKLILKENTYNELEYVASDILTKINEGYRYKDIVIYTNDINLYLTNIKRIFSMYNIPVYFNLEQNILSNNLIVYILTMLKILTEGLKKDITPIISVIKTGFIELENVNEFENYVREFGINGYNVENEFTFNNKSEASGIYDLEGINKDRRKFVNMLYDLKNRLNKVKTPKEIAKAIYEHLKETNVLHSYEKMLKLVEKENVNEYNRQALSVSKLYEIMDNIALAYDELSIKVYLELLEYGAKEQQANINTEKIDQVYISDINKNSGTEKKIGYIIGAYDGGLPTIQNEDNIFSDIELKKLKENDIDLKQSRIDRNNLQLFNIYRAINKIRGKLIVTVPSSKMSGGSLRPSTLIQSIKNILDVKLESVPTKTDVTLNSNFMSLITRICEIDENTNKDELEKLYNELLLYTDEDKYNKILEYVRHDKRLEEKTLDLIYKNKIDSSVSRLEQFKRCPFAYYAKYILNLKENKEYGVTNLDVGSLMHGVLEEISKYIISKNISWQEIILNEKYKVLCDIEIDSVIEKIFSENYSKYLVTPRYVVLKNKMKASMKKTIYAIADSFNHSDFRPLGYEIAFEDGELFAPIKIELDNGKSIFLKGKIDRVDSASINGNTYLRIVDYKSSEKDLKLKDVKDGLNLQLMTYMWAMLENKEKINVKENVLPAAVSYFTISSKLLSIPTYEKDEAKITAKLKKALKHRGIYIRDMKVLEILDNNVKNNAESYLAVTNKTMTNDDKTLAENTFISECNNMKKILSDISKDMIKGNVQICPNSKIKDVCKYCKFDSVCRKSILN